MAYVRKPENCPGCNGWDLVLVPRPRWVQIRTLQNSVCEVCKTDYSEKSRS